MVSKDTFLMYLDKIQILLQILYLDTIQILFWQLYLDKIYIQIQIHHTSELIHFRYILLYKTEFLFKTVPKNEPKLLVFHRQADSVKINTVVVTC